MAHPKYAMGEAPVESPHPYFGRKPGIWSRVFGDDEAKYWPTDGDVTLYKAHMQRMHAGDYGRTEDGHLRLPFDPELVGILGVSEEYANRARVMWVRDEYRKRAGDQRAWWEKL